MDEIEKYNISISISVLYKKKTHSSHAQIKQNMIFQSKSDNFHCSIPDVFVWTRVIVFFGRMKNTVSDVCK